MKAHSVVKQYRLFFPFWGAQRFNVYCRCTLENLSKSINIIWTLTKKTQNWEKSSKLFLSDYLQVLKYEIFKMTYPLTFSEILLGDTNSMVGQSLITHLLSKVKHLDSIATNANHSYFKLDQNKLDTLLNTVKNECDQTKYEHMKPKARYVTIFFAH